MQTVFFHPDAQICAEVENMTQNMPDVTVLCTTYAELKESGLLRDGAVVGIGNGFGIMDSGFGRELRDAHGAGLEDTVKEMITRFYGPELPIGAAVGVNAPDGSVVIYAPTMQIPMSIQGTDNVYRAVRAAANIGRYNKIGVLFLPLMEPGANGMDGAEAVEQMLAGIVDACEPISAGQLTWEHADRMHKRWHRFNGIPDDGFRCADYFKEGEYDTVEDMPEN